MSPVSLVVLTHNRREECLRTVARALALPERPPVIVVDNASRDRTHERLRCEFPEVEVLRMARNVGAAGRNAGAACATTPCVAFSDDDVRWAPGALARAVALLAGHDRLAAVTAQVLVGDEARVDAASLEMAASPLPREGLPGPRLLGFMAGATVFRRRAFLDAGGYEPRFFIGAEEKLLALDLAARGWAIVYDEDVRAHHHPSPMRERASRARLLARNELWIAWLRRPLAVALARARRAAPAVLARALPGLPWVLRRRRVLPAEVEAMCRMLSEERVEVGDGARESLAQRHARLPAEHRPR